MAKFSSTKCVQVKIEGLLETELTAFLEFLRTNGMRNPVIQKAVYSGNKSFFNALFSDEHYETIEKWLTQNGHSPKTEEVPV